MKERDHMKDMPFIPLEYTKAQILYRTKYHKGVHLQDLFYDPEFEQILTEILEGKIK